MEEVGRVMIPHLVQLGIADFSEKWAVFFSEAPKELPDRFLSIFPSIIYQLNHLNHSLSIFLTHFLPYLSLSPLFISIYLPISQSIHLFLSQEHSVDCDRHGDDVDQAHDQGLRAPSGRLRSKPPSAGKGCPIVLDQLAYRYFIINSGRAMIMGPPSSSLILRSLFLSA